MKRIMTVLLVMTIALIGCSAKNSTFTRKSIEGKWHHHKNFDNVDLWLEINNGKFKMYGGDTMYERRSGYIEQKSDSLYHFIALEGDDVYDTETMVFNFDGRHLKIINKLEDIDMTAITTFHFENVSVSTNKNINGYWHFSSISGSNAIMKIDDGDVQLCAFGHAKNDKLKTFKYSGHLEKNPSGGYILNIQHTIKGKTKEEQATLIYDGRHIKTYNNGVSGKSFHREIKYSWQYPCIE